MSNWGLVRAEAPTRRWRGPEEGKGSLGRAENWAGPGASSVEAAA